MNLLVTGAWRYGKENIATLAKMGHQVRFLQYEKDRLPCAYAWVEGIIGNGIFLFHPIERFSNLRFIQLTSSGFDRVPMEYVKEHGIEIHNARGVYSIPMAEFAVSGVLQIYKQSRFFSDNQRNHKWEKHRGISELFGKTVCVVGCGSVGTECAKRFSAFGCDVIGVNRSPIDNGYFTRIYETEKLDNALFETDILVITVPLNESTHNLFDGERLCHLKNKAIVVNISRGSIVNETDLIKLCEGGKIQGAVLDVFENEPIPENSPFWDMEQVILSPHNSFVGEGNSERLNNVIYSNLNKV